MKKFCKDLRDHATKIINYEKKDMIPKEFDTNDTTELSSLEHKKKL